MKLPLKSVTEVFTRFFEGKKPLKSKWTIQLFTDKGEKRHSYLCFYHYHHLILMFDLVDERVLYTWWETKTDKRGLDSALLILNDRYDIETT